MEFKSIYSFIGIYHLDKSFQDLLLNYEQIPPGKVISHIKKIDISTLSYETTLSKLVYFTLKFIHTRDKSDFDSAFDALCEMIDTMDEHSFDHGLSYILDVLLLGCMTYKINVDIEIDSYKQKLDSVKDGLAYMWLSLPLMKYGYCDEAIILKAMSGINHNLQLSYLEDLKKYGCSCVDVDGLFVSLAQKYKEAGDSTTSMQANYFYDLAIDIYKKYNMTDEIDAIKLKKEEVVLELTEHSISLEPEFITAIQNHIEKIKSHIETCLENKEYEKAFSLVFSPYVLPKIDETKSIASSSKGVFRQLATILPYTEGRNGKLKDGEYIRYHEFETYSRNLFLIDYQKMSALMEYVMLNMNFEQSVQNIYKSSIFHESHREFVVFDMIKKYLSKDYIGFMYQFVPNFEALIKILLKANGISTKNRETGVEEDISLNSLLSGKGKTLIEQIYGRDFYYLLDNLFLYEYGFNLRNALMHGEGLSYLDKQYADICFYVLVVLVSRGGVLEK